MADCLSPQEDGIVKTAVLVEKLGKKKYRASTSQPIALESEGRSADEPLIDCAPSRESGWPLASGSA